MIFFNFAPALKPDVQRVHFIFNYLNGLFMRLPSFVTKTGIASAAAILLLSASLEAKASQDSDVQIPQSPVELASLRELALAHNKQLMIARERIKKAEYQNKQAFAAYLPSLDFNGGYVYNQKELSLFDSDQLLPTKTFDLETQSYQYNLVKNPVTGEPIKGPDGQYVPSTVALIPKEAMTFDIHNVFFGAVTLTQPIYMGGKIVAMNKITKAAETAAREMHNSEAENVIYAVDAAYWMVVSLKAKEKLAVSYVELLDSLSRDVHLMLEQGVATKSDVLSVDVKLNAAQVDLTKVENGLVLSRMALNQVCGLPIDATYILADENTDTPALQPGLQPEGGYDMELVYANRPDLRALEQTVTVAQQTKKVALSTMLPTVALMGSYEFSNPNVFDGFKKRFNGAFSVGAMVSIPLWHWGGDYSKYKAAAADEAIARLKVQDARELIDLQVNQASFKTTEAYKTYHTTEANLAKADENLRSAKLAFREGMATADNVMAAQTAWLKAHSEKIDAMIEVQMCHTYLSKALGTLYR